VSARLFRSLPLIFACLSLVALMHPMEVDAETIGTGSFNVSQQSANHGNSDTVNANAGDGSGHGRAQAPPPASSGDGSEAQPPDQQTRNIQCTNPNSSGYTHGGAAGVPECYFAPQNAVTAQNSAAPGNWRQQLQQLISQVEGQMQLHAGTIGSDPDPDRALVNLPQCYWLTGASDPDIAMTLKLAGQPGPDGQQVQYQFVVAAGRTAVNWSFGDGDGSQTSVPLECDGHDATAAHQYTAISSPGRPYQVTVSEVFTITVTEYWQDSYGPHDVQLNLGVPPAVVSAPPIETTVGQEEGVPVAPSTGSSRPGG
jgi:hypothetical protein